MLASRPAVLVPPQPRPADVVELDSRLRPFSCPTGLHDFCSKDARHDVTPDLGLTG